MGQKIERDHQRFRKIVRGKVKSNLSKYISRGEMIGKKGNDLVSIPLPQIEIPQFRYGQKGSGGVGVRARATSASRSTAPQGDGEPAGRRSAGRPHPRSRSDDGGTGRDPRRGAGPAAHRAARQEEHRHRPRTSTPASARSGPESLRHFKRTFKRALKRQIASGTYDPGRPARHPDPRGQAVPQLEGSPEARSRRRASST